MMKNAKALLTIILIMAFLAENTGVGYALRPMAGALSTTGKKDVVRIALIGLGSISYFNMWNNLSLETLAGDSRGYFGKKVIISVHCIDDVAQIPDLLKEIGSEHNDTIDLIGLSPQPNSLDLCERLIPALKESDFLNPLQTLIVFGNQLPTYFPDYFLKLCPESLVVRGEGEFALRGIIKFIMGEAKLPEIPNLVFIDKTVGVIRTKLERPDLAQLPYSPSIDTYKSILANGGNVQITASRGCSWGRCSYCTRSSFRIGGEIPHTEDGFNSWQGFPVERVLRDIENVMKVGITEVEFSDDDFIGDRSDEYLERIYAIAEGIEKLSHLYGINFTFRIFTRPNIIYKEKDIDGKNEQMRQLLTRLKEVGLVKVYLGIEAGNKCQLQRYCRGMILADIVGAINLVRDLELGLDTGFIIFDPDISLEEMLENIVFFRRYNLIKTNQWPSRPIFLSQGSRMVDIVRQKGRLGPVDINLMRFAYKFKDSRVAKVSKLVEKVNAIAWEIIYALKVKSKKYFDPRKKDNESELAQDYVEENALIFLDLMEECAHSIIEGRDDTVDNIIVDKAETRIWGLVKHVEMDIAEGRILDEKGQMRKILDKIYSRACFTEKIGLSSQPIIRKGLAREVFAVIASAA